MLRKADPLMESELLLRTEGVRKSFEGTPVLSGISLELRAGEILGLVGENGAGKSTFVKCLLGLHRPDSGSITFLGRDLLRTGPAGIAAIPQEFNLVKDLTVAENIFLGREPGRFGFLNRSLMRSESRRLLQKLDVEIDPERKIDSLSVAEKQMVEIAKALSVDCRLLIMDEPTTVLNQKESAILFRIMRELKAEGTSILFISHRLEEIRTICDRVAVLRDGVLVSCDPAESLDAMEIARRMVGRELKQMFPPTVPPSGPPLLTVENLSSGKEVKHVSFELQAGITGLAGLAGAGRTELAETICALRKRSSGSVKLAGETLHLRKPADALAHGIVYLSEDRQGSGILTEFPLDRNVTLSSLRRYCHAGIIDREAERACAESYVKKFRIKTASLETELKYLSGGNQQKVALAKCLDNCPRVFLFDEPTRGVDIGARSDLYEFIRELAASGVACLLISSDLEEIIGMCDKVLVMRAGELAGTLEKEHVTEEEIMYLATGVN